MATTPHFAFYDDAETNLDDALAAAGVARDHGRPELFHTGPERACFQKLPPSARAGWNRAVDYYAEIVSPHAFYERPRFLLRAYLAGYDDRPVDERSHQFVRIAEAFRDAARPAWLKCRWPAQHVENRRWIDAVRSQLATYEETIAPRLERLYGRAWTGLPIRVDVVETVDWSGANTIILDRGGHILISNQIHGRQALEILFHEASHLLMDRDDPVRRALDRAARAANVTLPGDLWHVVLFYVTGQVVREVLAMSGQAGYTPALYDIFGRNPRWAGYRSALESALPGYIDGTESLDRAAAELVHDLPKPEKAGG